MRFLYVTHQYPPALGGSEKYIADLSETLAERGHRVDVYTSRSLDFHTWENALPPFERRNGVNVYRFWSMYRRGSTWRALHFGLRHYWQTRSRLYEPFIFYGNGPLAPGLFGQMLRHGRSYDLIHLNCLVYGTAVYGYWAARLRRAPVVITPHLHPEQEVTYNIGHQRTVLKGSNHILTDTKAERDFLLQHDLDLDPARVTNTGIGLRPEQYPAGDPRQARRQMGLPEDGFVVLFLSRKSKYKGLALVVQAFAQLRQTYPDLVLAAAGPETDDSQALWPQYETLDNLYVWDKVSETEKIALLQACDCLVLPSIGEAFGIVYLEAWLMGKPVVGARITAVSSVIEDGVDGLLAEPEADDVARAIRALIDQPQRRRAMGERGRKKVFAEYTVSRMADRVEAVYRQTLAARGIPYDAGN